MKKLSIIIVLLALASIAWGETLRHFHVHQLDYDSALITCDGSKIATTSKTDKGVLVQCK